MKISKHRHCSVDVPVTMTVVGYLSVAVTSASYSLHTSGLCFSCFVYFHPQFCTAVCFCKSRISWRFTHRSMDSVLITRGLYSHLRQFPPIPWYHIQTPSIIPWCDVIVGLFKLRSKWDPHLWCLVIGFLRLWWSGAAPPPPLSFCVPSFLTLFLLKKSDHAEHLTF